MKPNNFDVLRLFAATQVMLVHVIWRLQIDSGTWLSLLSHFPGVPIFFVISGFLVSASYERNGDVRNYARNRILRIYPALWCCVFLTIPVAAFFGSNFFNLQALVWLPSQLVGAIYTPGFLEGFGFGSYNGSLWTICVELQFYVLTPFMYWLFRKYGGRDRFWLLLLGLFVVVAFCIRLIFPAMGATHANLVAKLFGYSFLPHFYLFLFGVVVRRFRLYESVFVQGKGLYWLFGYLAFQYSIIQHMLQPFVGMVLVQHMFLGMVVISFAYSWGNMSERVLKGNDISYGVYIFHGLLINIFVSLGLVGKFSYVLLLCGMVYCLGYISWVAVERPFLRRKKDSIHLSRYEDCRGLVFRN